MSDTIALLATFLEGVYKTSTAGVVPSHPTSTSMSVHLPQSRAEDFLKMLDDRDLENYLNTSIEIQQIQILEQDAIFKMVEEFCNSYTEALKQGPTAEGVQQELGASLDGSQALGDSVGSIKDNDAGESSEPHNSKKRRGNLPKTSTNILKKWLYDHLFHPYPTEEEKKVLEQRTGMTLNQISNWFINARRRILQPMLESVRQSNMQGGGLMPSMGPSGSPPPMLASVGMGGMDPNMGMQMYRPMRG
eukprot:TRINITY_DN27628_c0_g1_i1.p1 TRINITY_DN27628_c0_g1~~TRINITY_DN27628_c0_g1_i1.p1  ORF type:complete len:269 (-),score=82.07 TRINITY_DN27628_c0_g1_i1:90-830(-)